VSARSSREEHGDEGFTGPRASDDGVIDFPLRGDVERHVVDHLAIAVGEREAAYRDGAVEKPFGSRKRTAWRPGDAVPKIRLRRFVAGAHRAARSRSSSRA
jgi:hypothetical protein